MCNRFSEARQGQIYGARFGRQGWQGFGAWAATENQPGHVPVNVRETNDGYEILVFAPGLNKLAFDLNVTGEVLTISFKKVEDASAQKHDQWLRREYVPTAFERQFQLNGKVDANDITARPLAGETFLDIGTGQPDVGAAWRWLGTPHQLPEIAVRPRDHGVTAAWRLRPPGTQGDGEIEPGD